MKKHNIPTLIGLFALAISIVLNRFFNTPIANFFSGFCTAIGLTGIFYGLWLSRKEKSKK
ncbi:MAG: hypothetical protein FWE63_05000 [Bacteroidales bacterium]|nr:hypothetical protein [Bacteroidales bacterium]